MDLTDYRADLDNLTTQKKVMMKNSKMINAVHGFMHTLHLVSHSYEPQFLALTQPELIANTQSLHNTLHTYNDDYSQVPHSPAADKEDEKLDFGNVSTLSSETAD